MKLIYTILSLLFCISLFGQGEIDYQDKIFYRNESTYAFLLNSNGIGLNYRYGKRIDAFNKQLFEIEINHLKHPKEVKVSTEYSNKRFVYGKLNSVITLKGGYGKQVEMFQKRDQGGISIRRFYSFGPTFAFMKPIYYEYHNISTGFTTVYYDKFSNDPAQAASIVGKAPLNKGFNELKIRPGIFGKFGFSFEYSKVDEIFHALELGAAFDAYVTKVPIMASDPGKLLFILPDDQFYLTLFISYRFGKVVDTRFKKRKKQNNIIE